jgi:hypothetical protein
MILVVLIGLWSFVAMLAGLVVGEGVLRVGGLGGLLLCAALAAVLEWRARRASNRQVETYPSSEYIDGNHFDSINFEWPREDRAA